MAVPRENDFMTTTLWLRISSIISLLFAIGHTLGGLKYWSPMGDNPVLQAMRTVRFNALGVNRSYFDFYMGFGYSISVSQVMLTILLWQFATLAQTDSLRVRPMIIVVALAIVVGGLIAWRFIFPVPALFSLALVATLIMACAVAR
jgi:hypothetical protein